MSILQVVLVAIVAVSAILVVKQFNMLRAPVAGSTFSRRLPTLEVSLPLMMRYGLRQLRHVTNARPAIAMAAGSIAIDGI